VHLSARRHRGAMVVQECRYDIFERHVLVARNAACSELASSKRAQFNPKVFRLGRSRSKRRQVDLGLAGQGRRES